MAKVLEGNIALYWEILTRDRQDTLEDEQRVHFDNIKNNLRCLIQLIRSLQRGSILEATQKSEYAVQQMLDHIYEAQNLAQVYDEGIISQERRDQMMEHVKQILDLYKAVKDAIEQDRCFDQYSYEKVSKVISASLNQLIENRLEQLIKQETDGIEATKRTGEKKVAALQTQILSLEAEIKTLKFFQQNKYCYDSVKLLEEIGDIESEIFSIKSTKMQSELNKRNILQRLEDIEHQIKEVQREAKLEEEREKDCQTTTFQKGFGFIQNEDENYQSRLQNAKSFHVYIVANRYECSFFECTGSNISKNSQIVEIVNKFRQSQYKEAKKYKDRISFIAFNEKKANILEMNDDFCGIEFDENINRNEKSMDLVKIITFISSECKKKPYSAFHMKEVIPVLMLLMHEDIKSKKLSKITKVLKDFKQDNPTSMTFVLSLDADKTSSIHSEKSKSLIQMCKAANLGQQFIKLDKLKLNALELTQSTQNPLSTFFSQLNKQRNLQVFPELSTKRSPSVLSKTKGVNLEKNLHTLQSYYQDAKHQLDKHDSEILQLNKQLRLLEIELQKKRSKQSELDEQRLDKDTLAVKNALNNLRQTECLQMISELNSQIQMKQTQTQEAIQQKKVSIKELKRKIELRLQYSEDYKQLQTSKNPKTLIHEEIDEIIEKLEEYHLNLEPLPQVEQKGLLTYLNNLFPLIQTAHQKGLSLKSVSMPVIQD